jgi:hypothetical protein
MAKELFPATSQGLHESQAVGKAADAVLPVTRWLAVFIIPFLVAASALLYIWPDRTAQTFAWTIKPPMTAMMLAAAYMGGIVFFVQAARARLWHTVKVGFWPVIFFAGMLGIATILHWDRFNHSHISFYTWTALYFTTPVLVFLVWLRNRKEDPPRVEWQELLLPVLLRLILGVVGVLTLLVSLFLFLFPQTMISLWPWTLTPLTARVLGAMFALPGMVGLGIALDPRWSAARIILQSQAFSILMILIAVARDWADLNPSTLAAWLFIGGLVGILVLIVALYASMESIRARRE